MNMIFGKVIIVLFLFFVSLPVTAQVDEVKISKERLSERVLVVWGGKIYKDQVVALATKKGIVIIDSGKSPTLAKKYRKIIENEFGRNDFIYLINTHYHFDHSSGNQVFAEAEIIAHETSAAGMKNFEANLSNFVNTRRTGNMIQWEEQFKNAEPGSEQYYRLNDILTTGRVMLDDYENNYKMTLPTITFSDRMTLDLGDISLNLYYWGVGMHTGDDILIHCPEEQLVFSGDLFFIRNFGFAFSPGFDLERYLSVLDAILTNNEIKWFYDCHNSRMSSEFMSLYHRYMKDVVSILKEADNSGLNLEQVLEKYTYEDKFSYISKSGVDAERLRRNHADNIQFTWYKLKGYQSAAEHLGGVIEQQGLSSLEAEFEKIYNSQNANYFFDESEFNSLGYQLMGSGKINEAIEIFKFNVKINPESGNVYDSLGEAYLNAGNRDLALKNYETSLKLDPGNNNAKQMIERIKSEM